MNRVNIFIFFVSLASVFFIQITNVYSAGVALGATRIIYREGSKQVSLPITNTHKTNAFLIQSWVTKPDGSKDADFIVTPPLFVLNPQKENTIRIIYTGSKLPTDQESIFYLNSKAIPSVNKDSLKGNNLQIATQSIIKIFMRPNHLSSTSMDSITSIRCKKDSNSIVLDNSSPYFVSVVQFYINSKRINNFMIPPKSTHSISMEDKNIKQVAFQMINDYGAISSKHTCSD